MDELKDELESIQNRCEIALVLIETEHTYLLPTILEHIFEGAQLLIDSHCIKEVKDEMPKV